MGKLRTDFTAAYMVYTPLVNGQLLSITSVKVLLEDSHRFTVQSPLALARSPPDPFKTGLKSTSVTGEISVSNPVIEQGGIDIPVFLCPLSVSWSKPVTGSENWIPKSVAPEATQAPSGDMATEST